MWPDLTGIPGRMSDAVEIMKDRWLAIPGELPIHSESFLALLTQKCKRACFLIVFSSARQSD